MHFHPGYKLDYSVDVWDEETEAEEIYTTLE